jgi:hypothetical protein
MDTSKSIMPPKKANSCPATPASHQLPESATDPRKIPVDLLKNLWGAALLAAAGHDLYLSEHFRNNTSVYLLYQQQ